MSKLHFLGLFWLTVGACWCAQEPDYDTFPVPVRHDMKEFWQFTSETLSSKLMPEEHRNGLVFMRDCVTEGQVPEQYRQVGRAIVIPASLDFVNADFASTFFNSFRRFANNEFNELFSKNFKTIRENYIVRFFII